MTDEQKRFAQQVIWDIEAIAHDWFGEGYFFAEWTPPANTYRWAIQMLRAEGVEPSGFWVTVEGPGCGPKRRSPAPCSKLAVKVDGETT